MKFTSILLAGLLVCSVAARPAFAISRQGQSVQRVEKIKANVMKRGVGESARVNVRLLDGTKMKGYIKEAGQDSFVFVDGKTASERTIAYDQVDSIKGRGLSTGAKIAIIISAGVGALVLLAVYAATHLGD